jgi:hypothetical protein
VSLTHPLPFIALKIDQSFGFIELLHQPLVSAVRYQLFKVSAALFSFFSQLCLQLSHPRRYRRWHSSK